MKFIIDQNIFEKFPEVRIGVLVAKGIDNSSNNEVIKNLRKIEQEVKAKFDLQTLVDNKKVADWREAYSSFGAKPKTYKNSVEALLRRVLQFKEIPDINKIVNIYNMISIKHVIPAGGDDIDKVDGNIVLTIADGGEEFTVLGSLQKETVLEGEVIYRDDKEVLCRRWNWRECDKTKMTSETKNVVIVLEALKSTTKEELLEALKDLKENIDKYCSGSSETHVLDKENSSLEI